MLVQPQFRDVIPENGKLQIPPDLPENNIAYNLIVIKNGGSCINQASLAKVHLGFPGSSAPHEQDFIRHFAGGFSDFRRLNAAAVFIKSQPVLDHGGKILLEQINGNAGGNVKIMKGFFYLFNFQVNPSLVSFTSKPRAASSSRILSLVAQSLLAFAFMRCSRSMSTTLP